MKKYALCVDKIPFCIFTLGEGETVKINEEIPVGAYALILRPSQRADFSAECYSRDGYALKDVHLPIAALSFFFKNARGLPPTELDIEYFGVVYNLDIATSHLPNFNYISPKSKSKLSKNIILEDKTEISCYDIRTKQLLRVFSTRDANRVSSEFLSSLAVRDGLACADSVVCASFDGEIWIRASDASYFYEYVFSGVCALILDRVLPIKEEYAAHFNGATHRFRILGNELVFFPRIEALSSSFY